jgi:hypothetical protein
MHNYSETTVLVVACLLIGMVGSFLYFGIMSKRLALPFMVIGSSAFLGMIPGSPTSLEVAWFAVGVLWLAHSVKTDRESRMENNSRQTTHR